MPVSNKGVPDLDRLQEAFFGGARDAPVGQQIEVRAMRFNQSQPHLPTAFDAGHLNGGLKARAGRRRPGYLQHLGLGPKEETQRYHAGHWPACTMSDSRHNWNGVGLLVF
jgi:hypothetical protein